jgi:hypothetical protein
MIESLGYNNNPEEIEYDLPSWMSVLKEMSNAAE